MLRREGLYSSHLGSWRRERQAGILKGLTPLKRGFEDPISDGVDESLMSAKKSHCGTTKQYGGWMSRADIARKLEIESFYKGGHGGYLSGGICRG